MAGILSLLSPLLPYIAGFIAVIIGYFTIRQRGVVAERQRQEKAQAKVQEAVVKAESKDVQIEKKVEAQIESIPEKVAPKPDSGDQFHF